MRTFSIFLGLLIVALIIGFLPRPLIKPDWKTPYEKALTEGDCETIDRIMELLHITGAEGHAKKELYELASQKLCSLSDVSEETIELYRFFAEEIPRAPFDRLRFEILQTSFLGERLNSLWLVYEGSENEIFRKLEKQRVHAWRKCRSVFGPYLGGVPNYRLLDYGLRNPDIHQDEIAKIQREKQSICASELILTARAMANAVQSDQDFERAERAILFTSGPFARMAPELDEVVQLLNVKTLPQLQKKYDSRFMKEEAELRYFECSDPYVPKMNLSAATRCSSRAAFEIGETPGSALSAAYFANRAKRLGWRDVADADTRAKAVLSPECYAAIIALEAEEAEGEDDPRFFKELDWPLLEGEVCHPYSGWAE